MLWDQLRLCVDYGSAYTKAVVVWPDGRWEPLALDGAIVMSSAAHTGGQGAVLVGEGAWRQAALDADGFVASPLAALTGGAAVVGDGPDAAVGQLAAATLRRVAAVAADRVGGVIGDVRLVVPAQWGPRRRTWLRHVAYEAGLGQPRLVAAPVAAADRLIASGVQVPVGAFLLICDLGAGCEVSVLRRGPSGFEVLSTLADAEAGGSGIDARLMATLAGPDPTADADPTVGSATTAGAATSVGTGTAVATGGSWWAKLASLRAAREALSQQMVVTVPMPAPAAPVVLHSRLVDELAEPVLHQAADLAAQAVAAAELNVEQLAGAYLIGGTAAMPAASRLIGARLGIEVPAVAQPGFAAVLGAADAGAHQPSADNVDEEESSPVPPLRRLWSILVPGAVSLGLYCHMVFTATSHNGTPDTQRVGYYVLATWGELGTAALFAFLACLAGASLFGVALAQAQHRDSTRTADHPAGGQATGGQAVGGQAAGGIALAVTAGLAIAALYGVAAGVYFGLPVSQPLRWALLPVLPSAAIAAGITWAARRRTPPQGWDDFLAFPISSITVTALGTLLLATWWNGPVPAVVSEWSDTIGRAGGMLIGVGVACTLVRHLGLRAALSLFLAFFGFLIVGPGGTSILAVTYAVAVALWWALRLWLLQRHTPESSHAR
jgi:hypothetical protein